MQKSCCRNIFLFIGISLVSLHVTAQIAAPYANYSDTADYYMTSGPDSVFLFNSKNDSTFIIVDTQNYKGYSVAWEKYEQLVGYQSITGGEKLTVSPDTIAEGYRVTLTTTSDTVVSRCWVLTSNFDIEITSKGDGDTLASSAYINCDWLYPINLKISDATLMYFNPLNWDTLTFENEYTITWEKELDDSEGGTMNRSREVDGVVTYRLVSPYWEDMWYTAVVVDSSGLEKKDSVYVKSYVPSAEFSLEDIELNDESYYSDRSDQYYNIYDDSYYEGKNSVPAAFLFTSTSENTLEHYWIFGDTSKTKKTLVDTIVHTYYYWGSFETRLVAKQTFPLVNLICYDTSEAQTIDIDAPSFSAPNAFSPPNGNTPYWRFFETSIEYFEIYIFNRYGKRVHEFKGNIRDWEGWNGKLNNTNRVVPSGVYFYVVKAYSYPNNIDEDENASPEWTGTGDNEIHKGFIHLFNTE